MGCGASKVDDLPLVTLCRERKDLIKAASNHRYALAAAHVSYFQSLRDIGDALRKFVDEELVISTSAGGSSSSPGSPVLTLPSDEGKKKKKNSHYNKPKSGEDFKNSSSSTSISHGNSPVEEEELEGSHVHLSSGSESDSELGSSPGHIHIEDSPEEQSDRRPHSYGYGYGNGYGYGYPPPQEWNSVPNPGPYPSYTHYNFMKKSGTPLQSFVYEEPETYRTPNGQWPDSSYGYGSYPQYSGGGFFGSPMGSSPPPPSDYYQYRQPSPPAPPPAPPSPPRVSTWDFLNIFDTTDNGGYPGYYTPGRYRYGSTTSSPDSNEVRQREGIPDLEDETEQEAVKESHKLKKKVEEDSTNRNRNSGEGTSRAVPSKKSSEGSSRSVPLRSSDSSQSVQEPEIKSTPDTIETIDSTTVSKSPEEEYARKKSVSFEVEEAPSLDVESSKQSSLTTLSAHGTRDLQEVVKEIKDEFEIASGYGKEVAVLLEVGMLPYQPRDNLLKAIFTRILYLIAPSMLSSPPSSRPSIQLSSRTVKVAKAYYRESSKDFSMKYGNLSSTLEKLYVWEKKLYKEVKDEERLRIIYEKKCKRLKFLDDHGAESGKIEATQASIQKLHTKINVCIRAVDSIATRIHKLRDEELLPKLTELIHGFIRMWKSMLRCHQKQFQAIMESKIRSLKANTDIQRDAGLKATRELELELLKWCNCFNNWINSQKSYIESLNGWLSRFLNQEPEETPDGIAPFSPGRIGAPTIFVICNDWCQAMERISEKGVAEVMNDFASTLHQLWERHDEEQRQRIKAEFLSKDFEKQLRSLRMERGKLGQDHDASSDKTALSKVASESGVSPLDDLKVDLDSMRKKIAEERARHKEAIKLVNDAASNSLQAGLIPIFKALGNFTSDVLKAHEQVRFQNAEGA
ncbi:nitrate regulatory gene2 protein-like [Ziziphus jujuba]|uniref:Nitrate regulatory gene2 protein-like n=1 Tax=Ziziphus jujuba TaxID=326968 RepID=A0ABM4A9Q7_ZIZJJ|nr:nitrate regulatory gene2 protein-like [Ziziphus jujuba]XP_060673468.1 nitrate regulatory gene2 protein-like [Ziziphus jujuba]XP_060673469.1 nitrate regulatory gene2 protein-like [Ziziphus jujuba]XP_060673470.1 nitrate regulatory gene2 protein-like [Ziziphus jujuba]